MNYKQLQALIYVSRHGTFKQAAEALYFESPAEEYVTPESIQYRIKQLEQELNVSLYRKRQGSSRVLLTREGQLFLREAIEVFQRMREWQGMFLDSGGGILTLASTQAVLIHRIHDAIMAYREKFPDVRIRAYNAPAEIVEQMVGDGTIDFGLSTRKPEKPELEYIPWKQSRMVLITPVGHPLSGHKEVRLAEIAPHPLVLLEPEARGDRDLIDDAFARIGIRQLNVVMETSNSEIIASYVEAGVGLSIVAETTTLRQMRRISKVPVKDLTRRSETGLLVREGQYLPARVRGFISLLDPVFNDWLKAREEQFRKPESVVDESENTKKKVKKK